MTVFDPGGGPRDFPMEFVGADFGAQHLWARWLCGVVAFHWGNGFPPMPARRITKPRFCVVTYVPSDAAEDRNARCSFHYFFLFFDFYFCEVGAVDVGDTKVLSHDAVNNQLLLIFFSSVS